jgi:hypothetical protein
MQSRNSRWYDTPRAPKLRSTQPNLISPFLIPSYLSNDIGISGVVFSLVSEGVRDVEEGVSVCGVHPPLAQGVARNALGRVRIGGVLVSEGPMVDACSRGVSRIPGECRGVRSSLLLPLGTLRRFSFLAPKMESPMTEFSMNDLFVELQGWKKWSMYNCSIRCGVDFRSTAMLS